jgi:hypothetical protein
MAGSLMGFFIFFPLYILFFLFKLIIFLDKFYIEFREMIVRERFLSLFLP